MEDHPREKKASVLPSLILRLSTNSPVPSVKDTRSFTYTVNPTEGPPSPTVASINNVLYPSLPPSILSEATPSVQEEPSASSADPKAFPKLETAVELDHQSRDITLSIQQTPDSIKAPRFAGDFSRHSNASTDKMGNYLSNNQNSTDDSNTTPQQQAATAQRGDGNINAAEAALTRIAAIPEATPAHEDAQKIVAGGLSRRSTSKAATTDNERISPNTRTMTRIVTFFKPSDDSREPDATQLVHQKSIKPSKTSKPLKSVKIKGEASASVDAKTRPDKGILAGEITAVSDAILSAAAEDAATEDDVADHNDTANDADSETSTAAAVDGDHVDEQRTAETLGVASDLTNSAQGPSTDHSPTIVAPVPLSNSVGNLITLLTAAAEMDATVGTGDDVPLLQTEVTAKTESHHLVVRKARNAALPCVLLKLLIGRELAQPTKDAMRVLARGESLALPGEQVEFVRTVV